MSSQVHLARDSLNEEQTNHSRFVALIAVPLVVGTGIASAAPVAAYEFTCAKINGNSSAYAYIKDQNSACGIVAAKHDYTPTPSINASTGWYYDDVYARTPSLRTLQRAYWDWNV